MQHEHSWVVVGIPEQFAHLVARREICNAVGLIKDPTSEERMRCYKAYVSEYPWTQPNRVEVAPDIEYGGER